MNANDRCVACGDTRRMHHRRGCEVLGCKCVGFVMLTEWGESDRAVTYAKDMSAKGSRGS